MKSSCYSVLSSASQSSLLSFFVPFAISQACSDLTFPKSGRALMIFMNSLGRTKSVDECNVLLVHAGVFMLNHRSAVGQRSQPFMVSTAAN